MSLEGSLKYSSLPGFLHIYDFWAELYGWTDLYYQILPHLLSRDRNWNEIHRIIISNLGDGFKHFLFSPLLGEDSHFD